MTRPGRASEVVSLLLALLLGIAGTSDAGSAGAPVGLSTVTTVANVAGAGGSHASLEILSRSASGSGPEAVAHHGPAAGLESEPTSECELDDDSSSAVLLPWADASRRGALRGIWCREESGAHPIHPGANRSRAPPHA